MSQAGSKKGAISQLNRNAAINSLIVCVVLLLAWVAGFASRLFAVIRFESIIHEFDPWFNYRATAYMVKHGFYNFLNWFDDRAWYPLGRIVGGTVYPGLMLTSGSIHYVLHLLHINVHIRDICVFLAPIFSGLTAISTYLLTRELWSSGAGLFAACFIAIVPGYISRSVAGSYDNEGIAIFALQFTYFLWIKSVKTGSVFWSIATALSYFYMVSAWGGYVFIINLIPLHVFVLLLMGRYSNRLFTSYTTFYIMGLVMSMQIPFVGFQPIRTSEHMAAAGVFALLFAVAVLKYLQSMMSKSEFKSFLIFGGVIAAGLVFGTVVLLTYAGYVAPWSGRFYSLWDTGYAKIHIPIIASVSEHQPTTWFSFFFDLHVLIPTFPAGLWYCIKNINDERVFVVLYALSAVYFAGVMVRLMLTLTPVVCMLSGVAFSVILEMYLREEDISIPIEVEEEESSQGGKRLYDKAGKIPKIIKHESKEQDAIGPNIRSIAAVVFVLLLMLFAVHCTWVTSNAYSSPSIVLASYGSDGSRQILDDFREAYFWLSQNTADDARVMSWWDYGYQIAGMANRTTLVDNNTWNNSHIALVGQAMSSNESAAYDIMTALDVDYVLVIFGGVIGYSGDDINKFLWMVRIAEGEHPKDIRESDYFTEQGEFRVDAEGSPTLLNCLMYKLSYYRFGELRLDYRSPAGFDRTRNAVIGNKDIDLTYLEEAYTTEHWLVRIYRVKKPDEFNRPRIPVANRVIKSPNFISKKVTLPAMEGKPELPAVVQGNRNFTRQLYNILARKDGNLFFSPISVHAVLSMAFQGAKGSTYEAFSKALHVPDSKLAAEGYQDVIRHFNNVSNVELSMANRIYIMDGFSMKGKFKEITRKKFLAEVEAVNFGDNVDAAKSINNWIKHKTKAKITDLIKPDMLSSRTRLVLVNAIYFKGNWETKFDAKKTTTAKFYVNKNDAVDVQMMANEAKYFYKMEKNLSATLLKLPYSNPDFSLVVILPNKRDGIADLEKKLANTDLTALTENMYKIKVDVRLPRFKIETTIKLNEPLAELGLGVMFDRNDANFSDMLTNTARLYVSTVIQKAFIEVNEEGTEAAAATAVEPQFLSGFVFHADHPFYITLIYQNHTILFSGRISDPTSA